MFHIPDAFLERVLSEDIPYNDVTTEAMGIGSVPGKIECFPKVSGVVSGISMAARLFEKAGLTVTKCGRDGVLCQAGETVLAAEGRAEQIHIVYKTAQNIMEYSSGISGRVRQMLDAARAVRPDVQVAVTRKHFPGTKTISLAAAVAGGAIVHRAGLSESILVFDQHRCFADDAVAAVARAKIAEPEKKIAVEVADAAEGMTFIRAGADIIQCERFSLHDLECFVRAAKSENPAIIINAAGGVRGDNAADFAAAGADVLVTSWVYFGRPFDIKMKISRF